MLKRTFVIIGIVIGLIGAAGSLLMLVSGNQNFNGGVLFLWGAVLAISIYYSRKDTQDKTNK